MYKQGSRLAEGESAILNGGTQVLLPNSHGGAGVGDAAVWYHEFMREETVRVLCLFVLLPLVAAVAGCQSAGQLNEAPTPAAVPSVLAITATRTPSQTVISPTRTIVPVKPAGKLSATLKTLTSSRTLFTASPKEQASAVGLPSEGPGSLVRDPQSRILVTIRMSDVAPDHVQALRDAGASIDRVAESDHAVTAYVAIGDIMKLAGVAEVVNIQEVLAR